MTGWRIRRAATLEGPRSAPVVVWRKAESGPMRQLIWAPELHEIDGKWYIYFAAAHARPGPTRDVPAPDVVLECADSDPLSGQWVEKAR